jgi:DNA-directed RNA polymerases I and III subunit RPAC1
MEPNIARLRPQNIENTHTIEHPASGGKTLSEVFSQLKLSVISETAEELILDIDGIEAPLANALRRIMISEVPTMAIEDVDLYQNTSVIPDEVLAHRLGLIPIRANPLQFDYKLAEQSYTSNNSILFKLHIKCERLPDGEIKNEKVYSKDLIWTPLPGQENMTIQPVHDDILIARLGPGQEIEAELHCEKGVGATHTKWSPVCTASYRYMPRITITKPLSGESAKALKKKCYPGVFDIEDGLAIVKNLRACTSCLECIRDDRFGVVIEKIKDHFICKGYLVTIESTGVILPRDILKQAILVLKKKARNWIDIINLYKHTPKN